jgi:hypothetical protein
MARFVDEALIKQATEVRRRLDEGTARAGEAAAQVENLLRELGLAVRVWLPLGSRTIRSRKGARRVEVFLGYSDEGDGVWGIKLRAIDPRGAAVARHVRFCGCPQAVQIRLLPHLKKLAAGVVGRAREMADLIENAVGSNEESSS